MRTGRCPAGASRQREDGLQEIARSARAPRIRAASWLCAIALLPIACRESGRSALDEIRALQARHRHAESIEALRERMDEDPTDPELNFRFGSALMEVGDVSRAIWPLHRALESRDHVVAAGKLLARALLHSGPPEAAIGALDRVLEVEPDDVEALALRAQANLETQRNAEALRDVERAVELDPDHPAIRVPRVLTLLEFGRVDEAEVALAALDDAPRADARQRAEQLRARLCVTNAALAFEAGDPSGAEVLYRDCVDAYPSEPLAVLAAADFYAAVGRPEHGMELLRRAFRDTHSKELGQQLTQRARSRDDDRARGGSRASLARAGPKPRASGTLAQP